MKIGIENDAYSAQTLRQNHPAMKVIEKDIRLINKKEDVIKILDTANIKIKDVYLVAGGPPCQGFSHSNMKTRNSENPFNFLYIDYFRFVKYINPKVFLFENVPGLRTMQKGEIFKNILREGRKLGYDVQGVTLKSEEAGVPQKRQRLIILGVQNNGWGSLFLSRKNPISVREAIDDLPGLSNGHSEDKMKYGRNNKLSKYQEKMREGNGHQVTNNLVSKNSDLVVERYKYIPQGGNWRDIPDILMRGYKNKENCHSGIYYRLKWDEPSIVISNYRKNMLIHPEQLRGLSVREAARIQSFPDSYTFFGPLNAQQQQVANAVPPILALQISYKIIKYCEEP